MTTGNPFVNIWLHIEPFAWLWSGPDPFLAKIFSKEPPRRFFKQSRCCLLSYWRPFLWNFWLEDLWWRGTKPIVNWPDCFDSVRTYTAILSRILSRFDSRAQRNASFLHSFFFQQFFHQVGGVVSSWRGFCCLLQQRGLPDEMWRVVEFPGCRCERQPGGFNSL